MMDRRENLQDGTCVILMSTTSLRKKKTYGNVRGSFPDGFTLPKRTSARALPSSLPPKKAYNEFRKLIRTAISDDYILEQDSLPPRSKALSQECRFD
jgi:hypothetical protein